MPAQVQWQDPAKIQRILRDLRSEADGKQLRKELTANMRAGAEPAVAQVRSRVLALQHVPSEARASVAAGVRLNVRGGQSAGVRASVSRAAGKGFKNAARAFNATGGWRHRGWGRNTWYRQQSSDPGFWEDEFEKRKPAIAAHVMGALDAMARRITR